jgi:hypothetical protein
MPILPAEARRTAFNPAAFPETNSFISGALCVLPQSR